MLDEVSRLTGVKAISLAQPLHFCNDMASQLSHVDWVHEAVGQVVPLNGRGVIVGMIDTGIDYNHINFKFSSLFFESVFNSSPELFRFSRINIID